MSSNAVSVAAGPTSDERRRQVAAIFAQGVMRFRRMAELAREGEFSPIRKNGLEVVSETRLSVSMGLASETVAQDCEVKT